MTPLGVSSALGRLLAVLRGLTCPVTCLSPPHMAAQMHLSPRGLCSPLLPTLPAQKGWTAP